MKRPPPHRAARNSRRHHRRKTAGVQGDDHHPLALVPIAVHRPATSTPQVETLVVASETPHRTEETCRGGGASPRPSVPRRGGWGSVFLPNRRRISVSRPNLLKSPRLFFGRSPPKKTAPPPTTTTAEGPWGSQGAIIAPCFPSFCYFPDPAPKKRPPASRKIRSGGEKSKICRRKIDRITSKTLFWQKLGYLTHKQCLW